MRFESIFGAKKETVVRQNRCDQEMKLLLFGCYFLFMATQLLTEEVQDSGFLNAVNMLLYSIFVPGFIFREGYRFGKISQLNSEEYGKKQLLRDAARYYVYYFILSSAKYFVQNRLPLKYVLTNALVGISIPSVSAVFFTLAVMLVFVYIFYNVIRKISSNDRWMAALGVICLLCVFLRAEGESYAIVAALFGASDMALPPCVPYFMFFMLGIWCWNHKPGFEWKIVLVTAAVTGVSLLLYRTPLRDLCRVTMSFLPVYIIYVMSEVISDLSPRFGAVRVVCSTIEPVFLVYSMLLFLLVFTGIMDGAGVTENLLVAVAALAVIYGAVVCFFWLCRGYTYLADYLSIHIRHKTAAYFVIYTAVFAFLMIGVFGEFIRTGRSLIWEGDGVAQYYPRAVYFANYIREFISSLLKGTPQLPMYDFTSGLGDGVVLSMEPLYFLYALFGEEHTEFAYNLLTILRFYLTGIASSIFFLYFKKDYFTTFIASIVYVFCGFSLFAGPKHPSCMIPMILFPLLVIALEEIMKNRRWYLMTVLVAVSLFSNYYFLYMNTIGLAVIFLVRFFCQKDRERKTVRNFFRQGFTIAGSYLLGVGISCIVLVTTFGMYVGSGRSGEVIIQTPSLFYYSKEWLMRCFLTFLTAVYSPGLWLKLGFLPIALLSVVILFMRKGRKELKILSAVAVIFMAFPLFGYIFSGFSSVINRWCYMIALLVAYIVADCLPDLRQMNRKDMAACAAVMGIYGYLAFFGNIMVGRYTKLAFLFLAATLFAVLLCQEQVKRITARWKQGILLVLTVALVCCQGYLYYGMDDEKSEYLSTGKAGQKVVTTPLAAVSEVEDDSFYRVAEPKLDYSTICSSQILDYNSIYTFSSVINSNILEYLRELGCVTCTNTQLMGFGNSTFMNALAAVKYYAFYGDEPSKRTLVCGSQDVLKTEVNDKKVTVAEYPYALPLGYTYEEAISEEELEAYGVLERQEVMLQKVLLNDSENTGNTDAIVTAEKLDILSVEEKGLTLTDRALIAGGSEKDASDTDGGTYEMKLKFEGRPNSETWIVLKNAVLEGDMSEERIKLSLYSKDNSFSYKFPSTTYRYGIGQTDYVFNLGYHEEAIDTCRIKMGSASTIQFDSFEIYSQPMDNLEQYSDALREDVLENVQTGTNRVFGTVSLEKDKILVLSIPYQKGWTAFVDGKEMELQRANYMYMALPLEAGEHEIELRYEIPYIYTALWIMAGSLALFAVLLIVGAVRKRIKKRKRDQER